MKRVLSRVVRHQSDHAGAQRGCPTGERVCLGTRHGSRLLACHIWRRRGVALPQRRAHHLHERQPLLQLQPTEAWQPHIEHQAAGCLRTRAAQECLRRRAGGAPQPHGLQEVLEGRAQRRLVIDDEDEGLGVRHPPSSLPRGTVN